MDAAGSDDLYREVILEHWRHPSGRGRLADADLVAEGANPLCGDEITLTLAFDGGVIREIRFEGHGCAISQASASMLTEALSGKSWQEATELCQRFKRWVTQRESDPLPDALDQLRAFETVRTLPARVKCALLACETLLTARGE